MNTATYRTTCRNFQLLYTSNPMKFIFSTRQMNISFGKITEQKLISHLKNFQLSEKYGIMKTDELNCPECGASHQDIYNIDELPIMKLESGGYSLQLGCSECDCEFRIIINEFSIVPF